MLQCLHICIYTHSRVAYTHTCTQTQTRGPRQSLILFMAAPELGFKYIFHATLPPMAANEEKNRGDGRRQIDEARQ